MAFLLLSTSAHALTASFSGNVTISNNVNNIFNGRMASQIPLGNLGVIYYSIADSFTGSGGSGSGWVAGVVGSFMLPLTAVLFDSPYVYVANVGASGAYNVTGGSVNIQGQAAISGAVFDSIKEIDGSGNTVTTVYLKDLSWATSGTASNQNGLWQQAYSGTHPILGGEVATLTCVVSNNVGVLNTGAVVTPNTAEIIVQINNWSYASNANHLQLVMFTGQASKSTSASISNGAINAAGTNFQVFQLGSGESATYFSTSGSATISGSQHDVNVNATLTASATLPGAFSALATATGSVVIQKVTVDFPAGASSITYDPNVGGYSAPTTSQSSANICAVSIFVLLIALFN